MSFETVSERLAVLQESNAQLKDLIERLRTIKFEPGSIPVDSDEDNVLSELTSEIQQTLKDQREDFELLQEEVLDLDSGRPSSELEKQRNGLFGSVERATRELKTYGPIQPFFERLQPGTNILSDVRELSAKPK